MTTQPQRAAFKTRGPLAVVGGGFTGLWTALLAKDRYPNREVALLTQLGVGSGASGRSAGFLDASLTHDTIRGLYLWPNQIGEIERVANVNFREFKADLDRFGIDCDYQPTGHLSLATHPEHLNWLFSQFQARRAMGQQVQMFDTLSTRAMCGIRSQRYLGALQRSSGAALIDPTLLVAGLRSACVAAGVDVREYTRVDRITPVGGTGPIRLVTTRGADVEGTTVEAAQVVMAAGASALWARDWLNLKSAREYRHAFSEPVGLAVLAQAGWSTRAAIGECGESFHYARLSRSGVPEFAPDRVRILWGAYRSRQPMLNAFKTAFPDLADLEFEPEISGYTDRSSRGTIHIGLAAFGRVAYAAGYSGVGIGASRYSANTMLDLLASQDTDRTRLPLVDR